MMIPRHLWVAEGVKYCREKYKSFVSFIYSLGYFWFLIAGAAIDCGRLESGGTRLQGYTATSWGNENIT